MFFLARSLLIVALLGLWANHCILGDLLTRTSDDKKAASGCHHSEDESSSSHHSECLGEGCCQPVLSQSSVALPAADTLPLFPEALVLTVPVYSSSLLAQTLIQWSTDPPLYRLSEPILLSAAPNAPPLA